MGINTLKHNHQLKIGLGIGIVLFLILIIFLVLCYFTYRKSGSKPPPVIFKNPAFGYQESFDGSDMSIFIDGSPGRKSTASASRLVGGNRGGGGGGRMKETTGGSEGNLALGHKTGSHDQLYPSLMKAGGGGGGGGYSSEQQLKSETMSQQSDGGGAAAAAGDNHQRGGLKGWHPLSKNNRYYKL